MKKAVLVIASSVLLSACGGGEPSDADIADALEKNLQQQIAASKRLFLRKSLGHEFLEKIGCIIKDVLREAI